MVALIIIGAIVLLLILLLLAPVSLRLRFRSGEVFISVHYLFLSFDLSAQALQKHAEKQERKKKKKPPKPEPEEEQPAEEPEKKKGKKETLQTVRRLLGSTPKGLAVLRRHLIVYRVKVDICVAREDAHETAIAYGRTCSFVSILLALLGELFVLRPASVQIHPDFVSGKSVYDVSLRLRISPLFVLWAGVVVLHRFLQTRHGKKRPPSGYTKKRRTRHKSKGGKKHESAASNQ